MQHAKKGKFIADSSQGSNAVVQGQRALSPGCYPNLQGVHKQLVDGLSGLVTCLQSNLIGPNLCGLFSNLGVCGLFQLSPDRFPFVCQAHFDWLAPGGLIIMLPWKTRPTPNLGCLSWRSLTERCLQHCQADSLPLSHQGSLMKGLNLKSNVYFFSFVAHSSGVSHI